MSEFENCTRWSFYAITKDNKLVLGFSNEDDAKDYCRKYKFKMFTRNGLKNKKINPDIIDNWIDDEVVHEYC